jgi:hypothetical protein
MQINRLRGKPQSAETEFAIADLQFAELALRCTLISEAAAKARTLLKAYKETGQMTAIRHDGYRMNGKPTVTGNSIQNVWNVRSKASELGAFAVDLDWYEMNCTYAGDAFAGRQQATAKEET